MISINKKMDESILDGYELYIRDTNLSRQELSKYEIGFLLLDKRYIEISKNISAPILPCRYTLLSKSAKSLREIEKDEAWQLFMASRESYFLILDIFEYEGKIQILMIHCVKDDLPYLDTCKYLKNKEIIIKMREHFVKMCALTPDERLNCYDFTIRMSFPIGLDENGDYFEKIDLT